MKSTELKPTKENLISTLKDDLLDRNADIFAFADILNRVEGSYSIALDSPWGSGKTFFVKHTAMLLNSFNPLYDGDYKDCIEDIKSIVPETSLEAFSGLHKAVYYDAWENDNQDIDPILSLIYQISKSEKAEFKFDSKNNWISIGEQIADFFLRSTPWGINKIFSKVNPFTYIKKIRDSNKKINPFEDIDNEESLHYLINEFFDKLIVEHANRLVIFVDELDRCNPHFAVKLLERIKHYFTDDRITFVFSINKKQLQSTIKQFYGTDFQSCRYLDRFFDMQISLPKADLSKYYSSIGIDNKKSTYELVCLDFISNYNLSLREIPKYLRMVDLIMADVPYLESIPIGNSYLKQRGNIYSLYLILPILIGLKMIDLDLYENFINGEDESCLIKVFKNSNFSHLPYASEVGLGSEVSINSKSSILKRIYRTIFLSKEKEFSLSYLIITSSIKQELIDKINILSIDN